MLQIAPRDDVVLAVAWNLPAIINSAALRSLLGESTLHEVVPLLRKTLLSTTPQRDEDALALARAWAVITVLDSSTLLDIVEADLGFFRSLVPRLAHPELKMLLVGILRRYGPPIGAFNLAEEFGRVLPGNLVGSPLSMNLHLWLTYDKHPKRDTLDIEYEEVLTLLSVLSSPSVHDVPAGIYFLLCNLGRLVAYIKPNHTYQGCLNRVPGGVAGFLPEFDAQQVQGVLDAIVTTEKLHQLAGEGGSVRFTFPLILCLAKWSSRARRGGLRIGANAYAAIFRPALSLSRLYSGKIGLLPWGFAQFKDPVWWRAEVEWGLSQSFLPNYRPIRHAHSRVQIFGRERGTLQSRDGRQWDGDGGKPSPTRT